MDVRAYKMMTGNSCEQQIVEEFPDLTKLVETITDRQSFDLSDPDLSLQAIYTPGHLDDHMSFALRTKTESFLISGDIILGTPSAIINDLDVYLKDLKALQAMNFDHILLPHSVGSEIDQIIVDAKSKLKDYIDYRESRLAELLSCFKPA